MPETLRIKYKKSAIGYSQRQKDTIRSLGFKRLGQTVEIPDNPAMRGMVRHVRHLVVILEDAEGAAPAPAPAGSPAGPNGPETGAQGR
jgi:large subunit ribosomal protein L30